PVAGVASTAMRTACSALGDADVLLDRTLEVAHANLLVVAQRQSLLGAGFQALLLQDQVLGVLVENRAEARVHARRLGEGLMVLEMDRHRRLRTLAVDRHRAQEQYLVETLAVIVPVRAEAVDHRQRD